jgi:methionyl aminopeptidase
MIVLKSKREIEIIRANGRIVAQTLKMLGENIKPGIKTKELDRLAKEFIKQSQAQPAFFGYRGFPANICVSINDEVVHGIPGERELKEGDIVSVDVGVLKNGYYGDAAYTFAVGQVSEEAFRLIEITRNSLSKGIEVCKAGANLFDISYVIQSYVEQNGFQVVRELVGHGIGQNMHEEPQIPNYGNKGEGPILEEGMVLAIEPMVNQKTFEVKTKEDGWTVLTADGSLSAHFEHTVALTADGAEVLTTL